LAHGITVTDDEGNKVIELGEPDPNLLPLSKNGKMLQERLAKVEAEKVVAQS
jgi:hypothetical protein